MIIFMEIFEAILTLLFPKVQTLIKKYNHKTLY